MITKCFIENPFNIHERKTTTEDWSAVKTVKAYVLEYKQENVKVAVNGRVVDDQNWCSTYLKNGDNIVICPIVEGGGGGGKNVLGIIAGIALSVVAVGIGSAVAGGAMFGSGAVAMSSWGIGAYIACAATMYIGGMLLQGVMGTQPTIDFDSNFQTSQTYSWSTAKTSSTQGSPIPLTYGRVKVTNNNVLTAHVTSDGDKQYLNLLVCLS